MKQELISTHILMLPFMFDKEVSEVNKALVNKEQWVYKTFDAGQSHENYNEYIYFYEHVRQALYSHQNMTEPQAAYYFEYGIQKGKFELLVGEKSYLLDVEGISIRTFETGVAVLAIELENSTYSEAEDILCINDFARRLYPQFLTEQTEGKMGLEYVKGSLLPHKVGLQLEGMNTVEEDFSYYEDKENISKDVTNLPAYIHMLLGKGFSSHGSTDAIHIEPIIDDRMFVLSMYANDVLSAEMKNYDEEKEKYTYADDAFWYKYIFIDGTDKTCQSRHMTKKLIAETTYDRWVEWGTLFGISRYSFVSLTGERFANNRLAPHMRTMYFQMFTLLLSYRASVLHFSKRVSDLTLKDAEALDLVDLQKNVSSLYKDYINFQNNLLFREVTAQEQGIEIYEQALRVMQIDEQVKNLDNEIAELHTYVAMKTEEENQKDAKNRERRLEKISELGAVFLPPSLLAGIYGMNISEFSKSNDSLLIGVGAMGLVALIGYMSVKKKPLVVMIASISMLAILGGSLYLIGQPDTTSKTIQTKEQHVSVKV